MWACVCVYECVCIIRRMKNYFFYCFFLYSLLKYNFDGSSFLNVERGYQKPFGEANSKIFFFDSMCGNPVKNQV